MEEVTIISYPGTRKNSLLSLASGRSRYMLPFGGKSRVVDFTIRNSLSSKARKTILFNDIDDDLETYVENYGPFKEMKFPPIKVVSREYSDIKTCYELILDSNTDYYIIYNGDNPSFIDFREMIRGFKKSRKKAVLYKMNIDGSATLANTILVTDQKTLLDVINGAMEEGRHAPNVFEMIINIMLNTGIGGGVYDVFYWTVNSVPDYYFINMQMLRDPKLFSLLYRESDIKSFVRFPGYAKVGRHAKIQNSFISDFCDINGTVINSIVFPGVYVGEKSVVKDSILLPAVRIGANARIYRTIVDEKTDFPQEPDQDYLNIGNGCIVGTEAEGLKNNDYPRSIFASISLVGKNCRIPDGSRIGGACYVGPGVGPDFFEKSKTLYDGLSAVVRAS